MKRFVLVFVWMYILVVSLSACGAELGVQKPEEDRQEKAEQKEFRYCNDEYFYRMEEENKILQCRRDGSSQKEFAIPVSAPEGKKGYSPTLCWVEQNWVYYGYVVKDEDDENDSPDSIYCPIYRVPLERDSSGENILFDRQEKLADLQDHLIILFCVHGDDLICREDNCLVKINMTSKEKTVLGEKFKDSIYDIYDTNDNIAYGNGLLYCEFFKEDNGTIIYEVDMETGTREEIWGSEQEKVSDEGVDPSEWQLYQDIENNQVFIKADYDKLWRYDRNTKKTECVFEKKQLKELVKEVNPWKDRDKINYYIKRFFVYHDRIYLAMEIEWCEDEYYEALGTGYIMLSCSKKDYSDLRYEKEISDCLIREAYPRSIDSGYGEGDVAADSSVETGKILYLLGDTLVMETTEDLTLEEGEGDEGAFQEGYMFIVYDMKTGEYKLCDKEDKKYWHLYYGGGFK